MIEKKQSKLILLAQMHASNILLLVAICVACFFGWQYWQDTKTAKVDMVAADKYVEIERKNKLLELQQNNSKLNLEEKEVTDKKDTEYLDDKKQLDSNIASMLREHHDSIYTWKTLMLKAKNEFNDNNFSEAIVMLESATNVAIEDEGLKAITTIRYAQALLANEEADKALTTISSQQLPLSFQASKQELIGDIKLVLNDNQGATDAYLKAWKSLTERNESRPILALKMESLGIEFTPMTIN